MKHVVRLSFFVFLALQAAAHGQELEFGDRSSETLTSKAWKALEAKNYSNAIAYAKKCVELYEKQAVEMQQELKEPVSADDRDEVAKKWALNDVGTCLYITGQAFEKQGKDADALASYKKLVKEVPFAQCWDPKGWFWKPAVAAKARIKALEFDSEK